MQKTKFGRITVKIEIPFFAGLLLIGTEVLARVAVQGIEQAVFSTVIEHVLSIIKISKGKFASD